MYKKLTFILGLSILLTGCNLAQNVQSETPQTETTATTNQESDITASNTAPEGATIYEVDTSASTLGWIGRMGPKSHTGTVDIQSGQIWVDDQGIVGGTFTVDMSTIFTEDGQTLIDHLKSEDFFEVETYPTAEFNLTSVEPVEVAVGESGLYNVKGDLTIKGNTNPISFEAELTLENGQATINSAFSIDRSKFDVRYGSESFFDDLGDSVISNDIEFILSLIALPE